jgi:hypothetical protein
VDDANARTGDPSSELTVIVGNGSDHLVRVALTARLRYGPGRTVAGSYVATTGHADHATVQYIAPGETSYPYRLGFLLPVAARDDVVLDVGIDNGIHERAIFAGSIKATRRGGSVLDDAVGQGTPSRNVAKMVERPSGR